MDNVAVICIMKSSLKIMLKTKLTFLLSGIYLFFFKQKYILFLETYFFKIPKNLIPSKNFFQGRYKNRGLRRGNSVFS